MFAICGKTTQLESSVPVFISELFSLLHMYYNLLIHSLNGHLGDFHFGPTMNIQVQISEWTYIWVVLQNEISDS